MGPRCSAPSARLRRRPGRDAFSRGLIPRDPRGWVCKKRARPRLDFGAFVGVVCGGGLQRRCAACAPRRRQGGPRPFSHRLALREVFTLSVCSSCHLKTSAEEGVRGNTFGPSVDSLTLPTPEPSPAHGPGPPTGAREISLRRSEQAFPAPAPKVSQRPGSRGCGERQTGPSAPAARAPTAGAPCDPPSRALSARVAASWGPYLRVVRPPWDEVPAFCGDRAQGRRGGGGAV